SAYRVVLPDKGREGAGALLQAWALVDNVSNEDWNGVQLSLATGAPLTFSMNLRAPRFIERPDASDTLPGSVATGPVRSENARPGDRDGDGIPDDIDRCPDVPGAPDDADGCPEPAKRVVVSSNEIHVLEAVLFATNSDQLAPEARPVLDAVVEVLKEHPEI